MGRSKKHSPFYKYLEPFFEKSSAKEIEQAKKHYWKEYRRKYSQTRRQENKAFQILFSFKEAKFINRQAEKYHISAPNYIKQSALADKKNIVDPIVIGDIRELVVLHHNSILKLIEEHELSVETGNQLLNQASQLENKILDFFLSLK